MSRSANAVQLNARLTHDVGAVRDALGGARGKGMTALIDGAYAGIMVGESDAGRGLPIVFSDGVDTSSWLRAEAVLDAAKRTDVVAYGVSVVSRLKPDFLHEMTTLTILDEFRHRYLVSYTPKGVPKNGWHKLDVRVKNRRATVKRPHLAGT